MKDPAFLERVIGDILELNGELVSIIHNASDKNFIVRYVAKRNVKKSRKRITAYVEKLKAGNVQLSRDNLVEFFTYTFNNYPPKGNFGSVQLSTVTIDDYHTEAEAYIVFDDYKCIITIDTTMDNFKVVIRHSTKDGNRNCNIQCNGGLLTTNATMYLDDLRKLNSKIWEDIAEFIFSNIKAYE